MTETDAQRMLKELSDDLQMELNTVDTISIKERMIVAVFKCSILSKSEGLQYKLTINISKVDTKLKKSKWILTVNGLKAPKNTSSFCKVAEDSCAHKTHYFPKTQNYIFVFFENCPLKSVIVEENVMDDDDKEANPEPDLIENSYFKDFKRMSMFYDERVVPRLTKFDVYKIRCNTQTLMNEFYMRGKITIMIFGVERDQITNQTTIRVIYNNIESPLNLLNINGDQRFKNSRCIPDEHGFECTLKYETETFNEKRKRSEDLDANKMAKN